MKLESYLESFKVLLNEYIYITFVSQNLIQKVSKILSSNSTSIVLKSQNLIQKVSKAYVEEYFVCQNPVRILFRKFQSSNHYLDAQISIQLESYLESFKACTFEIISNLSQSQNLIQKVSKSLLPHLFNHASKSQNLIQKVSKLFFHSSLFFPFLVRILFRKFQRSSTRQHISRQPLVRILFRKFQRHFQAMNMLNSSLVRILFRKFQRLLLFPDYRSEMTSQNLIQKVSKY